jgi:hypothetical protein
LSGRDGVDLGAGSEDCAEVEGRRQHADDGGLLAIHVEGLAHDGGVGVELAAPPCVAEENDGAAPLRRRLRKGAAHGGLHAEQLKEVGDDVDAGGGNGRACRA